MRKLRNRRPSAAMVVAVIALIAALGGTAYAAKVINGALIQRGTITAGKVKKKTLTGFQINTTKLGVVPAAKTATHTYWAVVHNPGGTHNVAIARASTAGVSVTESGGAVNVIFPANVSACADVAARNNVGTKQPRTRLRPDQHLAGEQQRARRSRARQRRQRRRRRLPGDRRLPLTATEPSRGGRCRRGSAPSRSRAGAATDMSTRSPLEGHALGPRAVPSAVSPWPGPVGADHPPPGRAPAHRPRRTLPAKRGAPGETSP